MQAIENLLMQQTDLEYELGIGEDCSTDGTGEIVAEHAAHYPERKRPLFNARNLGRWQQETAADGDGVFPGHDRPAPVSCRVSSAVLGERTTGTLQVWKPCRRE